MTQERAGFTLIELLVVMLIGSILIGIGVSTFQNAQSSFAPRSGRTMYATLHQRARAKAIELGRSQILIVDAAGDSAYIVDPSTSTVSDVTRFAEALNVDLRSSTSPFQICMTPRGFADPSCPAFPGYSIANTPIQLEFWLNSDSTTVTILPMGQLVGL